LKNKIVSDLSKIYESLKISFFTHQYLIKFLPKFLTQTKSNIESDKTLDKNPYFSQKESSQDLYDNSQKKQNSNRVLKDDKIKRINLKNLLTP